MQNNGHTTMASTVQPVHSGVILGQSGVTTGQSWVLPEHQGVISGQTTLPVNGESGVIMTRPPIITTEEQDTFPYRAHHITGGLQILIGILAILLQAIDLGVTRHLDEGIAKLGTGIWTGLIFIIIGAFGASMTPSRKSQRKCLRTTYMVLNILNAVLVVTILNILSIIKVIVADRNYQGSVVCRWLLLVLGLMEFVLTIVAASICCCCSPVDTKTTHTIIMTSPNSVRVPGDVSHQHSVTPHHENIEYQRLIGQPTSRSVPAQVQASVSRDEEEIVDHDYDYVGPPTQPGEDDSYLPAPLYEDDSFSYIKGVPGSNAYRPPAPLPSNVHPDPGVTRQESSDGYLIPVSAANPSKSGQRTFPKDDYITSI